MSGLVMSLPNVSASFTTIVKFPYQILVTDGTQLSGDLDSFQGINDGDVISWEGCDPFIFFPHFPNIFYWEGISKFNVAINFNEPSQSMPVVGLYLNYTFSGQELWIKVFYEGGNVDNFFRYSTSWTTDNIALMSYAKVDYIQISATNTIPYILPPKPQLAIDFLEVYYSQI